MMKSIEICRNICLIGLFLTCKFCREKNICLIGFSLFVKTTVLQGMWGEPDQMPNLSTDDSVQAEAVLRMIKCLWTDGIELKSVLNVQNA